MIWQYFGSEDSRDKDVVFFIDVMPATIKERAAYSKMLVSRYFGQTKDDSAINANLAVLNAGQLLQAYKGTTDELNNALYHTYDLHRQDFDNQVKQVLPRDVNLKWIRATRMLLSVLTRTVFRKEIKLALQSDLQTRVSTLKRIDLEQLTQTEKGFTLTDIKKLMAFQLGQTLALDAGNEVYTKRGVASCYPQLIPYLQRIPGTDALALGALLQTFSTTLEQKITTMPFTEEREYRKEDF